MLRLLKILVIFFCFFPMFSFAEDLKRIEIQGNERVSSQTIANFTNLEINQLIDDNILNESLKKLYDTKFFENVILNFVDGVLTINVKEFSIIQSISINGIKSNSLANDIKEKILLKEKGPFNKFNLENDLNTILNIFKTQGYYFVKIDVATNTNDNNSIDLIFDIDRGKKASIKKINFIGNNSFSERKLLSVITSEENKFWKFISKNKFLNSQRIELDKRLLKNYYLEKGFYEVEISDAYSSLINDKSFDVTFNIKEGKIYYFGDFKLNLPDDFDKNKFSKLNVIFESLNKKKYNLNSIDEILDEIEQISLYSNYEFIDVEITTTKEDNKVNFTLDVIETENLYVNRINILGNNITKETFIRDSLLVDEGDPLNKILFNKSINKLKSTGNFKTVDFEIKDNDLNSKNININVTEKPTGEIMAAAGYGSDGSTFTVGIKENNFNGQGISLATDISLSEDSIRGSIAYTHPNFAYSDRSLTTSLESSVNDKLTDFGYKSTLNKVSLGTRYEQFDKIFFSPSFSISDETLETTSSASDAYKKQKGSYFETEFSYGLDYDKRNAFFQPTSGFISNWAQKIPLVADQVSLLNAYQFTNYNEITDNMILTSGILLRSINSLDNKDVRVSKRLYMPSSRLRGFESGKVGPKDGDDYVGGNYIATFNVSSTIPYILEATENLDFKIFFDAANIWGVDYSNTIDDSNKIRSSTGIALDFISPVGPLSFSFSEAITKASTDKTESFRFQIGTTF
jgi:outer membrane protein insertion porin family